MTYFPLSLRGTRLQSDLFVRSLFLIYRPSIRSAFIHFLQTLLPFISSLSIYLSIHHIATLYDLLFLNLILLSSSVFLFVRPFPLSFSRPPPLFCLLQHCCSSFLPFRCSIRLDLIHMSYDLSLLPFRLRLRCPIGQPCGSMQGTVHHSHHRSS